MIVCPHMESLADAFEVVVTDCLQGSLLCVGEQRKHEEQQEADGGDDRGHIQSGERVVCPRLCSSAHGMQDTSRREGFYELFLPLFAKGAHLDTATKQVTNLRHSRLPVCVTVAVASNAFTLGATEEEK